MKRIFISDIHMGCSNAGAPTTGQPYGWLTPANNAALAAFLRSDEVATAQQLFLVGDVIDRWVCPIDVRPPEAADVIYAPENADIFACIRAFANAPGKQVIYIPGNHDMEVGLTDAQEIHPNIVFGRQYDETPLRVRHGHEGCLFNAPDPTGRAHPLGYFITRCTATGVNRGLAQMQLDMWTILKNPGEIASLLESKPLTECVFDVVLASTGLTVRDPCWMPDGSIIALGDARELYADLVKEWEAKHGTPASRAVAAEWDPYYDLPVGTPHLNIAGHSHNALASSHSSYGAYLNTGCWCGTRATFARAWDEAGLTCGQLCSWDGTVQGLSTIERFA